jgi:NAD(P)-dependent dehydrogenase (short-subunit alcohol dehydrogenase family)
MALADKQSRTPDEAEADAGGRGGRVAIVTGASSGNGRAIALRLARDGARVVCADLRAGPRDSAYDGEQDVDGLIRERGGVALHVDCDVADGESVASLYEKAIAAFGRVDVVVANAGISPYPPVLLPDEPSTEYRRVVEVNQDGAWWTCREGARAMLAQGDGGRIVIISSIAGLVGSDSGVHYCMSKGAVTQLARALAAQLGPHGITVNAVCPGFVRTAMTGEELADSEARRAVLQATPLGRLGEPSDVAGAVAFLVGTDANWITGVQLAVDGGYTAV